MTFSTVMIKLDLVQHIEFFGLSLKFFFFTNFMNVTKFCSSSWMSCPYKGKSSIFFKIVDITLSEDVPVGRTVAYTLGHHFIEKHSQCSRLLSPCGLFTTLLYPYANINTLLFWLTLNQHLSKDTFVVKYVYCILPLILQSLFKFRSNE